MIRKKYLKLLNIKNKMKIKETKPKKKIINTIFQIKTQKLQLKKKLIP